MNRLTNFIENAPFGLYPLKLYTATAEGPATGTGGVIVCIRQKLGNSSLDLFRGPASSGSGTIYMLFCQMTRSSKWKTSPIGISPKESLWITRLFLLYNLPVRPFTEGRLGGLTKGKMKPKQVRTKNPLPWRRGGTVIADATGKLILELFPFYTDKETNEEHLRGVCDLIVHAVNHADMSSDKSIKRLAKRILK